jgi:hypothetical protein
MMTKVNLIPAQKSLTIWPAVLADIRRRVGELETRPTVTRSEGRELRRLKEFLHLISTDGAIHG